MEGRLQLLPYVLVFFQGFAELPYEYFQYSSVSVLSTVRIFVILRWSPTWSVLPHGKIKGASLTQATHLVICINENLL